MDSTGALICTIYLKWQFSNQSIQRSWSIAEVWIIVCRRLAQMDVSFLDMRKRGLSAEIMHHFQIPFSVVETENQQQ